jgi:hypothetical protein
LKLPKLPRLFVGRYVELKRPRFPVSRELVSKQLREAELHPANGIKRVYVEEQPDYGDLELTRPIG